MWILYVRDYFHDTFAINVAHVVFQTVMSFEFSIFSLQKSDMLVFAHSHEGTHRHPLTNPPHTLALSYS